ncbi:hypothetical protein CBOM_02567 [Ceraceosorus bombacis]|uniref:Uncharacterized protein n=1 Tax=Ceraceosorus bombacis TaxID=401625 RepID=A0A0P1BF35_9BASI|nr:hypothetical protein CBOM_02567 [Ceraceosorus bombacis]
MSLGGIRERRSPTISDLIIFSTDWFLTNVFPTFFFYCSHCTLRSTGWNESLFCPFCATTLALPVPTTDQVHGLLQARDGAKGKVSTSWNWDKPQRRADKPKVSVAWNWDTPHARDAINELVYATRDTPGQLDRRLGGHMAEGAKAAADGARPVQQINNNDYGDNYGNVEGNVHNGDSLNNSPANHHRRNTISNNYGDAYGAVQGDVHNGDTFENSPFSSSHRTGIKSRDNISNNYGDAYGTVQGDVHNGDTFENSPFSSSHRTGIKSRDNISNNYGDAYGAVEGDVHNGDTFEDSPGSQSHHEGIKARDNVKYD